MERKLDAVFKVLLVSMALNFLTIVTTTSNRNDLQVVRARQVLLIESHAYSGGDFTVRAKQLLGDRGIALEELKAIR